MIDQDKVLIKHPQNLDKHSLQLVNYLRTICIERKMLKMPGVLTDFQNWIFIEYDVGKELDGRLNEAVTIYKPHKLLTLDSESNQVTITEEDYQRLLNLIAHFSL